MTKKVRLNLTVDEELLADIEKAKKDYEKIIKFEISRNDFFLHVIRDYLSKT